MHKNPFKSLQPENKDKSRNLCRFGPHTKFQRFLVKNKSNERFRPKRRMEGERLFSEIGVISRIGRTRVVNSRERARERASRNGKFSGRNIGCADSGGKAIRQPTTVAIRSSSVSESALAHKSTAALNALRRMYNNKRIAKRTRSYLCG